MNYILYKNIVLDHLRMNLLNLESDLIYDYNNNKINGRELLSSIDVVALYLIDKGIKRGDKVIFLVRPSIESVIYFFALIRAGGIIILVDPEMGKENFVSRINFSKADWILQDKILEKIEKYIFIKPVLRFFKVWFPDNLPIDREKRITIKNLEYFLRQEKNKIFNEEVISNNEDMLVVFTSGTVDDPKGVVHSYLSLSNALSIISSGISISKNDFLYASQFYFLLIGLMVSARAYIPKSKEFSSRAFFNISLKLNITSAFLLPYEGELLYKYSKKNKTIIPSSFKNLLFGSAPVTRSFLSRFSDICGDHLKVYGIYGATEILPISLIEMSEKINYKGTGDLLGRPFEGVKIKISSEKEIVVSGPQLFVKYLGDKQRAKYFYSGDLGRIDEDGRVILIGRKKNMIVRKGFNIYPALFETSICKIPGIIECSMVGVYNNEEEDENIFLFIVPDPKCSLSIEKIKSLLLSGEYSIDRYAYPDQIIFIKNIPLSGRSKKIDKKILEDIARKKLCIK